MAGSFPSANVAALLIRRKKKLPAVQEVYLERLCAVDPVVADARRLTQLFAAMVRGRKGEELDGWLEEAETSEAPVMRRFVAGLRKDLSTARRADGEVEQRIVEGFVHKLKLIKRQSYGRAGFDLLRARMLIA